MARSKKVAVKSTPTPSRRLHDHGDRRCVICPIITRTDLRRLSIGKDISKKPRVDGRVVTQSARRANVLIQGQTHRRRRTREIIEETEVMEEELQDESGDKDPSMMSTPENASDPAVLQSSEVVEEPLTWSSLLEGELDDVTLDLSQELRSLGDLDHTFVPASDPIQDDSRQLQESLDMVQDLIAAPQSFTFESLIVTRHEVLIAEESTALSESAEQVNPMDEESAEQVNPMDEELAEQVNPMDEESAEQVNPMDEESAPQQPIQEADEAASLVEDAVPVPRDAGPVAEEAVQGSDDVAPAEGFPGGPSNLGLLLNYSTHIARKVWAGEEKAMERILKIHRRGKWIKKLDKKICYGPRTWFDEAFRSGITSLRDLQWDGVDHVLISSFVEKWHPETNSFHFDWGEITITLHDVVCLLGLPIDGDALAISWEDADLIEKITNMFGWTAEELDDYQKCKGIKLKDLDKKLAEMIDQDAPMAHIASGYLMTLLGCTLFIDKSTQRVKHHRLMGLLCDHSRTAKYAWGTSVLACLYRGLGEASRSAAAGMDGCTLLLQSWIWSYFPVFRGHLVTDTVMQKDVRYAARYASPSTPKRTIDRLMEIRKQLDEFRAEDVEWMPFGYLDFEGSFCLSTYHGTIQFLGEEEPYMPDRVVRQFGRVQGVPDLPIRPTHCIRRDKLKRYEAIFHSDNNKWAQRHQNLHPILELPRVHDPWEVEEGYRDWFHQHTHPCILRTSTPPPPPPQLALNLERRVQRLLGQIRAFARRGVVMTVDDQTRVINDFYAYGGDQ